MSSGGFSTFTVPSNSFSLSYEGSKSVTINGSGALLILTPNQDTGIRSFKINNKLEIDNVADNGNFQPYLIYFTTSIVVNFYNDSVKTTVYAKDHYAYYLY